MERTRRDKTNALLYGGVVGFLLTAPLAAILYLAEQASDLPFVPFDLFDWIGRVLPGDIITRVIDGMVTIITELNLGETSSTAKTLEQIMGLLTFLGIGIVAGAVLFLVWRTVRPRLEGSLRYAPGVLAGVVIGLPLILISRHIVYGQSPGFTDAAPEGLAILWLAVMFVAWGRALSWAYLRLFPADAMEAPTAEPAALETPARTPANGYAQRIDRRRFLIQLGGATAAVTVFGAGIGKLLAYNEEQDLQATIEARRQAAEKMPEGLPNAGASVEPAPGTRPEYTPLEDHYRIDINSRPVEINGDEWRLSINGLVDTPLELSIDDLRSSYDPQHQYITLACISNPIAGDLTSTIRWTGATLQDVLADAGVQPEARYLHVRSADGFFETVDLEDVNSDARIMLAYAWDGIALLPEHGFPLRIYIPDHYGMKQPKWITEIEVAEEYEEGYWVVRGWDEEAQMRATSVIDVVAADMTIDDPETGETLVPIGGIAHAGARGISKVEVQVDGGDWVEAQLREPLSEKTWVIWRYDWPFSEGEHTFAVRCYEADGTMQITESNPTKPSGATGIHAVTREV